MKDLYLGVHINENYFKNLMDALKICKKLSVNVIQIYLGDKRLTTLREKMRFTKNEAIEIKNYLKKYNIKLFIHAILSLNYCNDPFSMRNKWGIDNLVYDMKTGYSIGASGVVMHMGTHKTLKINITYDQCQQNFIDSIKMVLDQTKKINLLLETPVNRKNMVGGTIEGIAKLYNNIPPTYRKRVKICIDTQHIFASGYNLRNKDITIDYFTKVDNLIGIKNIGLIHLNDSEKEFNSRINRHETTQKGYIFSNGGKSSLIYILNYAKLKNLPIVLETKYIGYPNEIKELKKLYGGKTKELDLKPLILKIFNKILNFHETLGKKGNLSTKFRIDSYRKAIKSIEKYKNPIYSSNDVKNLNGIGKGMIDKINEIKETGSLKIYNNIIKNKSTNAIYQFQQIWGIGPILARQLVNKKILTIKNLKKSIKNKKIVLTNQQKIGLKYYNNLIKKIPRDEITKFTKYLINLLNKNEDFKKYGFEIHNAGSYHMGKKESGDIDLILTIDSNIKINDIQDIFIKILKDNKILLNILSKGDEKSIFIINNPIIKSDIVRQMDVAFINKKYLPWYLLYFGSSKDFSKKIRGIASKKGYKLNEKGLFNKKTGKRIDFEPLNEKDIFNFLNIDYIKPENRN